MSMSLIVKSIGNVPDGQAILIVLSEYITLFPRLEVGVLKLVPQAVLLVVGGLGELQPRVAVLELVVSDESALLQLVALVLELGADGVGAEAGVEVHAQLDEDLVEGVVLLLHLLVVAAALLGLPGLDEVGHALEYFVGPAEVLVHEVLVVQFEEPVVELVLLGGPVPLLNVLGLLLRQLHLRVYIPFLRFLFVFLSGQPNVALLPEQRLEVVARDYLLASLPGFAAEVARPTMGGRLVVALEVGGGKFLLELVAGTVVWRFMRVDGMFG